MKLAHLLLPLVSLSGAVLAQDAATEARFVKNARQLTLDGKRSGEGYFSANGRKLVFQSEREAGNPFYQIYLMDLESGDVSRVSNGTGKTTCAWLHPDGKRLLFASTHEDAESKEKQDAELKLRIDGKQRRYAWDYDEHYEIYEAGTDGSGLKNLTHSLGYDAEGSYSPDGTMIAFASNRHVYATPPSAADQERLKEDRQHFMEIYTMKADGTEVKRLTEVPGYDGGPFFSADGKRICWRRFNEAGDKAEIWSMNADGSDQRALTKLGAMSWAPYFHPSGQYVIFTTNLQGFDNFELYLVDAAGTHDPVRVTTTAGFDGLPVFSPDGTKLSWTSGRTPEKTSQIFLAEWDHAAALAALGLTAGGAPSVSAKPPVPELAPEISAADLRAHVTYLASDALDGRLTGTEGERLATAYVAGALEKFGLDPAGTDGFYAPFDFTAGVELGAGCRLAAGAEEFKVRQDWMPLSFTTTGEVPAAGIVFAGYGMELPMEGKEPGYSSYFHLDVKDKWVMALRYVPEGLSAEQRQKFTQFSSLRYKAMTARQHGAKGILFVSGPNSKVREQLVGLSFDASLAGSGVAAVSITDAVAEKLLAKSGKTLKALQDELDKGEPVAGFPLPDEVKLGGLLDVQQEKRTGRNVAAVLKSAFPQAPALLIGAHVDHLGREFNGNSRATEAEKGQIHHGADDNASGTAGMMEIAQWMAAEAAAGRLQLKRDVIFAAWSGEEAGLLGSASWARTLAKQAGDENGKLTTRLAAVLNMDMIGRLDKTVILQGLGSSDFWKPEIEKRNVPVGLALTLQSDTYAPTDTTTFYPRGVPILNAFTGSHEDYHRPTDTADKINYPGAEKISRLMGLIASTLATKDEVPAWKEAKSSEQQGQRSSMRVYLGTIPDYSQGDIVGVKLSGVSPVGPAGKAGVKGGDVITGLAGKEIKNIYDYTFLMSAIKVGEETDITVLRDGKTITLKITPVSRD